MEPQRIKKQAVDKLYYGYCRVSSTKQTSGTAVSLAAQEEKLRHWAGALGVVLADVVIDAAESAKSTDRPGLLHLLDLVNAGRVRSIVVTKLDRITRSVVDLADLLTRFQKHDVALVSLSENLDTGTASGRLVLNLLITISQWEREIIAERTTDALRHKKSHLRVYSRLTPFGYHREGDHLVADPAEQAVIVRIQTDRQNGSTLQAIADSLNKDGIPTKQGKLWVPRGVKDVLDNRLHRIVAA